VTEDADPSSERHIGDPRFRGVYFLLAGLLPLDVTADRLQRIPGQEVAIFAEGDEDNPVKYLLGDADRGVKRLSLLKMKVLDQFEAPPLIRLV
jgi:hypothetical protein